MEDETCNAGVKFELGVLDCCIAEKLHKITFKLYYNHKLNAKVESYLGV